MKSKLDAYRVDASFTQYEISRVCKYVLNVQHLNNVQIAQLSNGLAEVGKAYQERIKREENKRYYHKKRRHGKKEDNKCLNLSKATEKKTRSS